LSHPDSHEGGLPLNFGLQRRAGVFVTAAAGAPDSYACGASIGSHLRSVPFVCFLCGREVRIVASVSSVNSLRSMESRCDRQNCSAAQRNTLYFDVRAKFAQIGHTSIFSIFYSQEDHGQTFKRVNSSDFCDAFRMYAIPDKYATDSLWFVSIIRKRHSGTQELLMRWGRVLWCHPARLGALIWVDCRLAATLRCST